MDINDQKLYLFIVLKDYCTQRKDRKEEDVTATSDL